MNTDQDDTAHRICCGAGRAFVFHICDQQNRVCSCDFRHTYVYVLFRNCYVFHVNLNAVLDAVGVRDPMAVHLKRLFNHLHWVL